MGGLYAGAWGAGGLGDSGRRWGGRGGSSGGPSPPSPHCSLILNTGHYLVTSGKAVHTLEEEKQPLPLTDLARNHMLIPPLTDRLVNPISMSLGSAKASLGILNVQKKSSRVVG